MTRRIFIISIMFPDPWTTMALRNFTMYIDGSVLVMPNLMEV